MYKVKDNSNPLYKTNINEAITYDFYNEQDVFIGGFNGFNACRPVQRNHKMDLIVEWYDNYFYSEEKLNLNADIYKYIRIGLRNGSNLTNSKIYFITDTDGEWNEEKSVEFSLRSRDELYFTYTVPIYKNPAWKGRITQVKFVPLDYHNWSIGVGRYGDFGAILSYNFIQFAAEDLNPDALCFWFKYDTEGFKAFNGNITVFEYMLQCTVSQSGFYLESPQGLRLDTNVNRYLRIRQNTNSTTAIGKVAYTTVNDKEFAEERQFEYVISGSNGEFVEYTIDLSSVKDQLWQIRVYPLGDSLGVCEIDYLIFDTVNTSDIYLDFPAVINCNECNAYAEASGFSADASMLKYLHINMQNNTLSYNAYIQWITDKDGVYDDRKKQRFVIKPMDDIVRKYTVGLNQNQYWRDNILGIRIVPAAELPTEVANVKIADASICRDGDTMSQNRNIVEGYLEEDGRGFLAGWFYNRAGGDILGYCCPPNGWTEAGNLENDNSKPKGKLSIISEGNGNAVGVYKPLATQCEGVIDWCFSFQIDKPDAKGMYFSLENRQNENTQKSVLSFEIKHGFLYLNDKQIEKIAPFDWYCVRTTIDLDNGSCSVAVNGEMKYCLKMQNILFDTVNIYATGEDALRCTAKTSLYKVGYLYEDCRKWFRDNKSINENTIAAREKNITFVRRAKGLVDCEVSFLLCDLKAEGKIELTGEKNTFTGIQIVNGDIVTVDKDGEQVVLWEKYKPNVWYTAIMTVNTVLKTADFKVNGQMCANDVPIAIANDTFDEIKIFDKFSSMCINSLRVKPHIFSTVPFIDKVSSRTGLVGMQAWFILGDMWARVHSQYEMSDKTPYMGHYDDMNVDSVDWQIKYLAEHGVDFISQFMYTDLDRPAYQRNNFISTFLYYSANNDKMKFCITMGELFQTMTREKMLNNVLPFLIENYFKHPSYMKVNNKPVLMVYSWSMMIKHMTAEGLAELIQEMRDALIKEGFDGIILIGEDRPHLNGNPQRDRTEFKKSGVDRIYAYCNIYTADAAQRYYFAPKQDELKTTLCMGCGWDNRYWGRGYFIINNTPAEFEEGIRWMAEKTLSEDRLDDLVLIENWSEYGEGHSINPSNMYGFGYLNAIRKAFTDADELHYDNVPEGAYNALNITGTYPDCVPIGEILGKRFPMPKEYEKKHNIFYHGD